MTFVAGHADKNRVLRKATETRRRGGGSLDTRSRAQTSDGPKQSATGRRRRTAGRARQITPAFGTLSTAGSRRHTDMVEHAVYATTSISYYG